MGLLLRTGRTDGRADTFDTLWRPVEEKKKQLSSVRARCEMLRAYGVPHGSHVPSSL